MVSRPGSSGCPGAGLITSRIRTLLSCPEPCLLRPSEWLLAAVRSSGKDQRGFAGAGLAPKPAVPVPAALPVAGG
ncbi:hypothetical protein MRX96_043426 [Rhipicephalus microplus]